MPLGVGEPGVPVSGGHRSGVRPGAMHRSGVEPGTSVVLVGHGSRDPRSAQALHALTERVGAELAGVATVELAFLELNEPSLEHVLARARGRVRLVPLLLTSAFHARDDLPGRARAALRGRRDLDVSIADVLGPHPMLDAAVAGRVRPLLGAGAERAATVAELARLGGGAEPRGAQCAAGHDGVLLLGVGSSHDAANAEVDEVAERVGRALEVPARAAFVTRGRTLHDALSELTQRGAASPAVVPWFLAPGRLLDAGLESARSLGLHATAATLSDSLTGLVMLRALQATEPVLAA